MVRSRPLLYDGDRLSLGALRAETAVVSVGGLGFARDLEPGDVVSLHWDWICERLSAGEADRLERETVRALALANALLRQPAGSILG